jgi:hypothetical protein
MLRFCKEFRIVGNYRIAFPNPQIEPHGTIRLTRPLFYSFRIDRKRLARRAGRATQWARRRKRCSNPSLTETLSNVIEILNLNPTTPSISGKATRPKTAKVARFRFRTPVEQRHPRYISPESERKNIYLSSSSSSSSPGLTRVYYSQSFTKARCFSQQVAPDILCSEDL